MYAPTSVLRAGAAAVALVLSAGAAVAGTGARSLAILPHPAIVGDSLRLTKPETLRVEARNILGRLVVRPALLWGTAPALVTVAPLDSGRVVVSPSRGVEAVAPLCAQWSPIGETLTACLPVVAVHDSLGPLDVWPADSVPVLRFVPRERDVVRVIVVYPDSTANVLDVLMGDSLPVVIEGVMRLGRRGYMREQLGLTQPALVRPLPDSALYPWGRE